MACNLYTFSRLVFLANYTALTKEHREGGDRPLECSISEWTDETEYQYCDCIG